mgnify:CR=1 FL=1
MSPHDDLAHQATAAPEHTDAFWMPFTANRQFKKTPRLLASAEGMYYRSTDGREILDGTGGLWCCNAGHARPRIVKAIQEQAATLDFAPTFQMGHPLPFVLAERLKAIAPDGLDHVFFTNSGSESVDTALKIALAYHRARGEGQRTRLIGREKGYHGVGFGGIAVGGMVNNRKFFGPMLPGVDHLRHTLDIARNGFNRGLPKHGIELAEDLERLVQLHDASTIAAVIVEPISGSAGVVLPPEGYLKRLREICDKHGILLIFDEVITGFGRLGTGFGADFYGVQPDMLNFAKCVTNGVMPMGGVICTDRIYDAMMGAHGNAPDHAIEFFHGYTYSGHPVACAAALATLDLYKQENLFERAGQMGQVLGDAMHSAIKGLPHVIGIRSLGLACAVELAPMPGMPGKRAFDVFMDCFHKGVLVRNAGENLVFAPPYIVEREHIETMVSTLADAIRRLPA